MAGGSAGVGRRRWGAGLAGLALAVLVALVWRAWEGGFAAATHRAAADTAAATPWGRDYFPNPIVTDQHGRRHRFYDDLLAGKTVAVNTFFTVCADVCPLGTAKMLELQRLLGPRMGRDIHFYSLSVDPLRDTPEAMAEYARRYGVGPGWLFLTASEADIRLITRKLGLGVLQQTDARESHSTTLSVGEVPTGRWMKSASTDNPRFLAAHMATFLGWPADPASATQGEARPLAIGDGEFLFRNGCAACHDIGGGRKIGPDLLDVGRRREARWLHRFILEPDRMIAEGDPLALRLLAEHQGLRMPNLGLSRDEVAAIVGYIDARSDRVRAAATAPAMR